MWTGYTFEEVLSNEKRLNLVKLVDVLIDGKFQKENKDLTLKYRGSSNQRVIDVKRTLEEKKIILIEE